MHILLAEGDESILQSVELMLKSEHFNVYSTTEGEEAVSLGKLYDYDLIVLGDMPDLPACDVIRQIRTAKIKTPILCVSGRGNVDDRVKALDLGADDCMTRPFHKDELVARIRTIVRRARGHAQSVLTVDNVKLRLDQRTVEVAGAPLHLTGKEYQIFELLMVRRGAVQSKEALMNHLYGGMDEPCIKIVDVLVCKLRKKFTLSGALDLIETVWGRGYLIRGEGTEQASPSLAPELRDAAFSPADFPASGVHGGISLRRSGAL